MRINKKIIDAIEAPLHNHTLDHSYPLPVISQTANAVYTSRLMVTGSSLAYTIWYPTVVWNIFYIWDIPRVTRSNY